MNAQGIGWFGERHRRQRRRGPFLLPCRPVPCSQRCSAQSLRNFPQQQFVVKTARADFVNNINLTDDGPDAVTGCSLLFIYYLFSQLGFGITEIVAAGASTLGWGLPEPHRRNGHSLPILQATVGHGFSRYLYHHHREPRQPLPARHTSDSQAGVFRRQRRHLRHHGQRRPAVVSPRRPRRRHLPLGGQQREGRSAPAGTSSRCSPAATASSTPSPTAATCCGIATTGGPTAPSGGPTTTARRSAPAGTSSRCSPAVTASSTPSPTAATCCGIATTGESDGTFRWADNNARKVGVGWNFKQVFSGGDGVIYGITDNGDLLWYRHDGRNDGTFTWADNNAKKVGVGWNFKQVFSGGRWCDLRHRRQRRSALVPSRRTRRLQLPVGRQQRGRSASGGSSPALIYAVTRSATCCGTATTDEVTAASTGRDTEARKVGNGWNFKQVFSGGDGVIYAIADNGDLLWYPPRRTRRRHLQVGRLTTGKKVGNGWNFKQVFSGGDGVIYAITDNGDLLWYPPRRAGRRQLPVGRQQRGKKVGNGWNFKQVFSGGDGVIYAITDNGDLLWYRHDGRSDGSFPWADNTREEGRHRVELQAGLLRRRRRDLRHHRHRRPAVVSPRRARRRHLHVGGLIRAGRSAPAGTSSRCSPAEPTLWQKSNEDRAVTTKITVLLTAEDIDGSAKKDTQLSRTRTVRVSIGDRLIASVGVRLSRDAHLVLGEETFANEVD